MLLPGRPGIGVMPSRETTWSIAAGGYAFLCGTVLMASLHPITGTLAGLFGVEFGRPSLLLASPATLLGATVWWAVVERRGTYSYLRGALFGGLTAVATVVAWVLRSLQVWGLELVATGWFVVAWMLAMTAVAGLVAGVPLVYARRRLTGGRTDLH